MRSICSGSMISGGDRAMVSPVTRMSTPLSKAPAKDLAGARAGRARPRLEFDAGHQARCCGRRSTQGRVREDVHGVLPVAPASRRRARTGPPRDRVQGGDGRRRRPADGRNRCSRGRARSACSARLHHGVVDLPAGRHRAHRHGGVGEALGQVHHVGRDAETLGGEGRAQAAEAGDHLVEDQQDAVARRRSRAGARDSPWAGRARRSSRPPARRSPRRWSRRRAGRRAAPDRPQARRRVSGWPREKALRAGSWVCGR